MRFPGENCLPTSHKKSLRKHQIFIFTDENRHLPSCTPCKRQHIELFPPYGVERRKKTLGRESNSLECLSELWSGSIMVDRAVSRSR